MNYGMGASAVPLCGLRVMAEDELRSINDFSFLQRFLQIFVFIPQTCKTHRAKSHTTQGVLVSLHHPHELSVLNGNCQRACEV